MPYDQGEPLFFDACLLVGAGMVVFTVVGGIVTGVQLVLKWLTRKD